MNIFRRIQNKSKVKLGIEGRIVLILAFLGVLLSVIYYCNSIIFFRNFKLEFIVQKLSFSYYLKPGEATSSTLLIGDLNGLNPVGYKKAETVAKSRPASKEESLIVVPALLPQKSESMPNVLDAESLINQTVNNNNIIVVDNFCTKNWNDLRKKEIYQDSFVSPGAFCGSEPEVRDLDSIIEKYNVKEAVLLFDTESYKKFISNFTGYLQERNISYSFVASDKFNDIF
jgi:hypothetical protein